MSRSSASLGVLALSPLAVRNDDHGSRYRAQPGLARSLGLRVALCQAFAEMDADELSVPLQLEKE
ncbi:hypothetical protein [Microbacterium sp. R86528]|uniref:hypothetical protein n=1 Tax=Microbacterium sp. R86528 TaxID=3093864 RepID=UPI0037CAFB0D